VIRKTFFTQLPRQIRPRREGPFSAAREASASVGRASSPLSVPFVFSAIRGRLLHRRLSDNLHFGWGHPSGRAPPHSPCSPHLIRFTMRQRSSTFLGCPSTKISYSTTTEP